MIVTLAFIINITILTAIIIMIISTTIVKDILHLSYQKPCFFLGRGTTTAYYIIGLPDFFHAAYSSYDLMYNFLFG